jgi:hypothetical protein
VSVAFDAATRGASLSFSHTVVSNANGYLVVGIVGNNADTFEAVSVMANGKALSRLHRGSDPSNILFADLWGMVNPDVGVNAIVATMQGSGGTAQGAISFTGVDQNSPFGGAGSDGGVGLTASSTPMAGLPGWMMACVVGANAVVTLANGTEAWNDGSGDAMSYVATDGTYQSLAWTLASSSRWTEAAVMLRPVGAPRSDIYYNRYR